MTAVAPTHPKLLAVMQPRGKARGRNIKAEAAANAQELVAHVEQAFIPEPPKVDPTKVAADAFAAAHPEGTKALLAKLLAAREAPVLTDAQVTAIWSEPAAVLRSEPQPVEASKPRRPRAPKAPEPTIEQIAVEFLVPEPLTVEQIAALKPGPLFLKADEPVIIIEPTPDVLFTREAWMLRAVDAMRPWFPDGHVVPEVRISFGWPGGRGNKQGVRGQCWYTTDDAAPAIFVSPDQNDPVTILGIILHEMVHASGQAQHKPNGFGKVAGAMGFTKPFTSSENKTQELVARLAELLDRIGPMDHARVNGGTGLYGSSPQRPPIQSTRMVKLVCSDDGYTVRTTRKWIEVGLPACPAGHPMAADEGDLAKLGGGEPGDPGDNPPPGGWQPGDEL